PTVFKRLLRKTSKHHIPRTLLPSPQLRQKLPTTLRRRRDPPRTHRVAGKTYQSRIDCNTRRRRQLGLQRLVDHRRSPQLKRPAQFRERLRRTTQIHVPRQLLREVSAQQRTRHAQPRVTRAQPLQQRPLLFPDSLRSRHQLLYLRGRCHSLRKALGKSDDLLVASFFDQLRHCVQRCFHLCSPLFDPLFRIFQHPAQICIIGPTHNRTNQLHQRFVSAIALQLERFGVTCSDRALPLLALCLLPRELQQLRDLCRPQRTATLFQHRNSIREFARRQRFARLKQNPVALFLRCLLCDPVADSCFQSHQAFLSGGQQHRRTHHTQRLHRLRIQQPKRFLYRRIDLRV